MQGGDLDALINDSKKTKKTFDEKTVMDWFVQLLLAVHYMHSRRVLHRDLKTRYRFCYHHTFCLLPTLSSYISYSLSSCANIIKYLFVLNG